jgi:hypothetical protein
MVRVAIIRITVCGPDAACVAGTADRDGAAVVTQDTMRLGQALDLVLWLALPAMGSWRYWRSPIT